MAKGSSEQTRFWQSRELGGVELLHAQYVEQRFAPHVHEGFVFTVIEQGAQRFRHRGSEHLAPLGVALQLGFADQSHLSRQFKQAYGVGPGAPTPCRWPAAI